MAKICRIYLWRSKCEDRKESCGAYSKDPQTRFLVGNPTTGGFGLTLTACTNVIYFSNNYNLEVRKQSEDRAHRMGQKGFCNIY